MTAKPPLPDGYELPTAVNGWVHAPASNKNGHIWMAPDDTASVGVYGFGGDLYVKLLDERVTGFGRADRVYDTRYDHEKDHIQPADPDALTTDVVECVEAAIDWMNRNEPPWRHPDVEDAVFDPPAGYVLDRYYLEARQHVVYYRRQDADSAVNMAGGRRGDTDPTIDTRAYLRLTTWRGSGNSTVALAPWLRAHDHECHEVVDCPDECGLAIAVTLAREWVREQTGWERDGTGEPAGQATLSGWDR